MIRWIALILLTLLLCFPVTLWAHGDAVHIRGTVTETADNSIVVKTTKGETVTIAFSGDTTFRRDGIVSKTARPKVGDRLIAEGAKEGKTVVGHNLLFSTPKSK